MIRPFAARRIQIVATVLEGRNVRATCRLTGAAKGTVLMMIRDLRSERIENLERAVNLLPLLCNFPSIQQSLRATPAMPAGFPNHVWSIDESVAILDSC